MNGKILKISSNDLYGNVDDRRVAVFAAFNHLKYMNRYVVFSFLDEYNKKKLYFGSLHLKDNSIVVFAIKDNNVIDVIKTFINSYVNGNVDTKEYEMINIAAIEKIELVSYNDMDFENISLLDKISIKRENAYVEETTKKSKPVILYLLIFIIIGMVGYLGFIYFYPDAFKVELKKLECTKNDFNKQIEVNFDSNITIKFNEDDEFESMDKVDIYKFSNEEDYSSFKENNGEVKLSVSDGRYKYDDENMELRIISSSKLVIVKYNEIYEYFKNEGYSCIEGIYNE